MTSSQDLLPTNSDRLLGGLTPQHRRIILIGWVSYALYYLGRLNLSATLSLFEEGRGLTGTETGLMFSGFFWSYAIGGFLVGSLSDRFSPGWFIAGGLIGSGLVNLVFPFLHGPWLLIVFWSANGLAQSAGWTPMIKMISAMMDEHQARRMAGVFGTSFVVGTSVSWSLAGLLAQNVSLEAAFVVPGVVLIVLGFGWITGGPMIATITSRSRVQRVATEASPPFLEPSPLLYVVAASTGFAYIALLVWTPKYFLDVHGLSTQESAAAAALLPLLSLVVIQAISRLQRRTDSEQGIRILSFVVFGAGALFVVLAAVVEIAVLGVVVFVLAISAVTAAASLLLGQVPILFVPATHVGRLSGRIGLFSYLGGGAGAVVIGTVRETSGWPAVFVCLGAAALLAAVASFLLPTSIEPRIQ